MEFFELGFILVYFVIYFAIYGIAILLFVASYVLNALGLFTVAKRRGISKPWLSWIPVGNAWILGSISDQYQQQMKNKETKRRKLLVILDFVALGAVVLFYIFIIVMIIMFMGVGTGISAGEFTAEMILMPLMIYYLGLLVFVVVLSVASIIQRIFIYVSYYDLFASCDPDKAVLFLLLSIFVPYALQVLVFLCRNKDDGMLPAEPEDMYELPEGMEYEIQPQAEESEASDN